MSQRFSQEIFEEQLAIGAKYEALVCKAFNDNDIPAVIEELELEYHGLKDDFTKYQKDVIIRHKDKPPFILEVKSRNLNFWDDPLSFPFEDAVLETVWGWDMKAIKPRAIIFVSQRTECMLVANVKESFPHWTQRMQKDSLRGIESYEYFIPSRFLRRFSELVEWLKHNYA